MSVYNIPAAMRERAQWMLAGANKAPVAYDWGEESVYAGSKNRPDQWLCFSDAVELGGRFGLRIGYCPTPDDPFTIIDLDWKEDRVYDVEASDVKASLWQEACKSTYVERSVSGKGAHIVIEGKLPHDFNAQTAGIECYGNKGFVVMTGHIDSVTADVAKAQPWLDYLANKYKRAFDDAGVDSLGYDIEAVNHPSPEDMALDDALIASMSSWQNARNLEHFFYGHDLRPDGGGGSEGDMSLIQAFMKFTRSKDRIAAALRMFLKTPRAKAREHYKSRTSDWGQYLGRTLNAARMALRRDEQIAKDYDFREGSNALMAQYQAQIEASRAAASEPAPSGEASAESEAPASAQQAAPANSAAAPGQNESGFAGFNWLTKDDLARSPDIEWVVKGLFPSGGVGAIYGESGAGKSFVGIDLIAAIAQGSRWFGLRTKQLPVSVFALEGEGGLKGRVKAWELVNKRDYPTQVYFWDSAKNGSFALRDADRMQHENADRLVRLCADLRANGREGGVVVIDTLNQASDGADENSSRDMGELLKAMKFIQRETGSLVLIVHHATKSKENQSMRGHSSLYGAMDGILEVLREVWTKPAMGHDGKPVEQPRLIEGRRGWRAQKVKDGRDGYEKLFDMREVQIGFDEDGPVMSVAIEPVATEHVDVETGEVHEIVNTGTLARPKIASGPGAGGSAGRGKREPMRGGSADAPAATRPKGGETYSAAERANVANAQNSDDPTPKNARGRPKGGGAQQQRIIAAIDAACKANGGPITYETAQMAVDALSPSGAHQSIKNMTRAFTGMLDSGEIFEVSGNSIQLKDS